MHVMDPNSSSQCLVGNASISVLIYRPTETFSKLPNVELMIAITKFSIRTKLMSKKRILNHTPN